MFITTYGSFRGDLWENACQVCFKLKYSDSYSEVKATSPGDHGIEGFTRTGKVFQCYCPDENYSADKLYAEQRDKITTDLNKLVLYQKQLKQLIGNMKIKEWIFVTPSISKNDLIKHCTSKSFEYRAKGLEILDNEFEVLAQDIQYLLPHLQIALKEVSNDKLIFDNSELITEIDKINYKDTKSDLVENSNRKHRRRFSTNVSQIDQKVDNFTDKTVKNFLDGKGIVNNWRQLLPQDYERFLKIVSQIEEDVEEMCAFPTEDNNKRYEHIKSLVFSKIQNNFDELHEISINNLTNYIIADWILRCPINFE